jgi:hypothetical protein
MWPEPIFDVIRLKHYKRKVLSNAEHHNRDIYLSMSTIFYHLSSMTFLTSFQALMFFIRPSVPLSLCFPSFLVILNFFPISLFPFDSPLIFTYINHNRSKFPCSGFCGEKQESTSNSQLLNL